MNGKTYNEIKGMLLNSGCLSDADAGKIAFQIESYIDNCINCGINEAIVPLKRDVVSIELLLKSKGLL